MVGCDVGADVWSANFSSDPFPTVDHPPSSKEFVTATITTNSMRGIHCSILHFCTISHLCACSFPPISQSNLLDWAIGVSRLTHHPPRSHRLFIHHIGVAFPLMIHPTMNVDSPDPSTAVELTQLLTNRHIHATSTALAPPNNTTIRTSSASASHKGNQPLPKPANSPAALIIIVIVVLYLVVSWTYCRWFDVRFETPYLYRRAFLASCQLTFTMIGIVWISMIILIWSLIQTYACQHQNYVERSEQYIPHADHRLAALARAEMASEEDLLYDLPDLFEFIPGFICETSIDNTSDDSPKLRASKFGPPPIVQQLDGANTNHSQNIHAPPTSHSTPHLLLPTLTHKINGCRRFCTHCQLYKPDRAHHW